MGANVRGPAIPPEAAGLGAALRAQAEGDGEPLVAWHRNTLPWLRAVLVRRGADPASADEAAGDALERAVRRLGYGDPVGDVPAWLLRIARNARIDDIRSRRRDRAHAVSLSL